jgi:hypothetical protein
VKHKKLKGQRGRIAVNGACDILTTSTGRQKKKTQVGKSLERATGKRKIQGQGAGETNKRGKKGP